MPSADTRPRRSSRSPKAAPRPDKVLQAVLSTPWAISEAGLHRVLAIASRLTISPQALEQVAGKPLDNTRSTTVRDGVATIDISGPLLRRAPLFSAISGAADYESITRDLRAAMDDRSVSAIVLHLDSPGGEVSGCSELAQQILAAREEKPIYAYVGGECCSACYWLASACTEIHCADTALVGNLGVLMTMVDDSRRMKAEGMERITIVSSQTPSKLHDVRTEPGRERVQSLVDSLAAVFLSSVAAGRGIDVDTVQAEYGAGGVFVGAGAVSQGLADQVTTYEALLASIIAAESGATSPLEELSMPAQKKGRTQAKSATPKAGLTMSQKLARQAQRRTPAAAAAEDTTREKEMDGQEAALEDDAPDTGTCAECDTTLPEAAKYCPECGTAVDGAEEDASASETQPDEEKPTPSEAAATAERTRIVSILGYAERFGMKSLMPFINDPSCTKEKAAAQLLEQPAPATPNRLRALKADDASVSAAPQRTGVATADSKATRMLRSFARVNPGAVPDSVKTGSLSQ